MGKMCVVFLMSALVAGCARGNPSGRAFTDEWALEVSRSAQEDAKREVVLLKKQGIGRTAIKLNEKGKPTLSLGKDSGMGADVRVSHGAPKIDLFYTWKIRPGRLPKKQTVPTPRTAE